MRTAKKHIRDPAGASDFAARVDAFDWTAAARDLDAHGCAVLNGLLTPDECDALTALYPQDSRFRSRVVMARHGFGRGEYQYFSYPLPEMVATFQRCHATGQTRPTPLLLRYGEGDYNCLHQDLYGDHVFPLQVAVLLSQPGRDFSGGEFVLTEQRPRMQSRAEAVPLAKGDAVAFAVHARPVQGTRGYYRVTLRHGVSRIRTGQRHTLGVIFHDAI
jgi:hypothetical protein